MRATGYLLLALVVNLVPARSAMAAPALRVCITPSPMVDASRWRAAGLNPPDRPAERTQDAFFLALLERATQVGHSLHPMPSRRCTLALRAGQVDAILGLSATPERMPWARFPMRGSEVDEQRAYRRIASHFFVRLDSPLRWTGAAFSGGSSRPAIGVITESSAAETLAAQGHPIHPSSAGPTAQLRMLRAGRVEAVLLPDNLADLAFAEAPDLVGAVRRLQPAWAVRSYHLVLSPPWARQNSAQAQLVWEAIPQITAQPLWQQILTQGAAGTPSPR